MIAITYYTGIQIFVDTWISLDTNDLFNFLIEDSFDTMPGLILGLRPANERRRYKVTPSLIGWVQT